MANNNKKPSATIAVPNYNMGRWLDECLASALSQTYDDFELVIVDNASTDDSRLIINRWAERDPRVRAFFYDEHANIPIDNWNRCLEKARGRCINFLHADDRLVPTYLEKCMAVFDRRPDLGYVYSEKEIIDIDGHSCGSEMFYRQNGIIPGLSEARVNLLGWHTVPVQTLMRTECLRSIGGYNFTDSLALLMLNIGWDVGYLNAPLVQCRKHELSATTRMIKDKSLILSIFQTKTFLLNECLTPETEHLMELHPRIMQRLAFICLDTYGIDVLGWGEKDLCREYMHQACSFWLGIAETPLFKFLQEALQKDGWTRESLRRSWADMAPKTEGGGVPYPLPEGSLAFEDPSQGLTPAGENL